MAEFWRALRTLKALQAEQAAGQAAGSTDAREVFATKPAALAPGAPMTGRWCQLAPPPDHARRPGNRKLVLEYATPNEPEPGRTLHEAAARWHGSAPAAARNPDEPENRSIRRK